MVTFITDRACTEIERGKRLQVSKTLLDWPVTCRTYLLDWQYNPLIRYTTWPMFKKCAILHIIFLTNLVDNVGISGLYLNKLEITCCKYMYMSDKKMHNFNELGTTWSALHYTHLCWITWLYNRFFNHEIQCKI